MFRSLCALAALMVSLAGCASYPDVNRQRLLDMPQHYAQFDAVLGWEFRSIAPETVIDGEFRNVRYLYMDNVEVWVAALDQSGKTLKRSASFLLPRMVSRDQTEPFTVRLPVAVAPGDKLRFTYKYTAVEGASDGGGDVGNWMQTFDVVVPRQ